MDNVPGVTGNAILLLGYIAGAVDHRHHEAPYEITDVDPEGGVQTLRHRVTGNTFRLRIEQIGGVP